MRSVVSARLFVHSSILTDSQGHRSRSRVRVRIDGNAVDLTSIFDRERGPDLQNVLWQSHDYLTIMPRRSYDRLTTDVKFAKHVTKTARRILRRPTSYLQGHKIMGDIVRKCITIFLSHYRKSILRLTQDNRMINGQMFCKSGPSRALELGFKKPGFSGFKNL